MPIEIDMESYTGILFLIWALTINFVWYSAKHLADSNGLKISWWRNHYLDFSNMVHLIRFGSTQNIRRKAMVHLAALITMLFVPFILLGLM